MDEELRAYIDGRRRQVQAARGSAVHQNGEWGRGRRPARAGPDGGLAQPAR
jgi:hypothetical protein